MTAIRLLGLAATPLAFAASSAAAQEAIAYDSGDYEYAQAEEATAEEAPAQVIFRERPVVQSIPSIDPDEGMDMVEAQDPALIGEVVAVDHGSHSDPAPAQIHTAPAPRTLYAYPAVYAQPAAPGSASRVIYRRAPEATSYTYVYESSVPVLPMGGRIVQFDREAWLAECRARIAPVTYYEEDGDGEVAGAAIGAVAGGVIGNRIAGRGNRTLGTLAGAGLGALAGAAIGDSLDDRTVAVEGDDRSGECEAYLDGYMESARTGGLHGQQSSTGEYMLVPVTVMVPRKAVYSDGAPVER